MFFLSILYNKMSYGDINFCIFNEDSFFTANYLVDIIFLVTIYKTQNLNK